MRRTPSWLNVHCRCSCYLKKTMNTPTLNGGEGRGVDSFVLWNHPTTILSPIIAEKVSLSREERCPFSKGDRYKDYMTDIFPGPKILCPLNGGIPWIEVPKRGDSTVQYFIILFKFRSSLRKKKLLLWRHLVIQVWYTGYNSVYHNWVSCSNTRKYCNLIGSYQ